MVNEVNSHAQTLLAYLHTLYERQIMCDATLIGASNFSISVHRVVLGAFSERFDVLARSAKAVTVVNYDKVYLTDVGDKALKTVATYLYTSQIDIDSVNVQAILDVAQRLCITKLVAQCQEFILQNANLAPTVKLLMQPVDISAKPSALTDSVQLISVTDNVSNVGSSTVESCTKTSVSFATQNVSHVSSLPNAVTASATLLPAAPHVPSFLPTPILINKNINELLSNTDNVSSCCSVANSVNSLPMAPVNKIVLQPRIISTSVVRSTNQIKMIPGAQIVTTPSLMPVVNSVNTLPTIPLKRIVLQPQTVTASALRNTSPVKVIPGAQIVTTPSLMPVVNSVNTLPVIPLKKVVLQPQTGSTSVVSSVSHVKMIPVDHLANTPSHCTDKNVNLVTAEAVGEIVAGTSMKPQHQESVSSLSPGPTNDSSSEPTGENVNQMDVISIDEIVCTTTSKSELTSLPVATAFSQPPTCLLSTDASLAAVNMISPVDDDNCSVDTVSCSSPVSTNLHQSQPVVDSVDRNVGHTQVIADVSSTSSLLPVNAASLSQPDIVQETVGIVPSSVVYCQSQTVTIPIDRLVNQVNLIPGAQIIGSTSSFMPTNAASSFPVVSLVPSFFQPQQFITPVNNPLAMFMPLQIPVAPLVSPLQNLINLTPLMNLLPSLHVAAPVKIEVPDISSASECSVKKEVIEGGVQEVSRSNDDNNDDCGRGSAEFESADNTSACPPTNTSFRINSVASEYDGFIREKNGDSDKDNTLQQLKSVTSNITRRPWKKWSRVRKDELVSVQSSCTDSAVPKVESFHRDHQEVEMFGYECSVCKKLFVHYSVFALHRKWHDFRFGMLYTERHRRMMYLAHTALQMVHYDILNNCFLYHCDHCSLYFSKYSLLRLHVLRCHSCRYSCKICHVKLSSRQLLFTHRLCRHLVNTHRQPKVEHCSLCTKDFHHRSVLVQHQTTAHSGYAILDTQIPPNCCRLCGDKVSFRCFDSLCRHLVLNHGLTMEQIGDVLMGSASVSETHIQQRVADEHSVAVVEVKDDSHEPVCVTVSQSTQPPDATLLLPFNCEFCDKRFRLKKHITNHLYLNHIEEWYKARTIKIPCEVKGCNEKFPTSEMVTKHVFEFHPSALLKCQHCEFRCATRKQLRVHKRVHTGMKETCEFCGKDFSSKCSLRSHRLSAHGFVDLRRKIYKCTAEGCSYVSLQPSGLRYHMQSHTPVNQYTCEYCGRKVRSIQSLQKHLQNVHLGDRPYICEHCGLSFALPNEFRVHVKRHVNKLTCEICGFQTADKASLRGHLWAKHEMRLSSKQTMFNCEYCTFSSDSKSRYVRHVNSIHLDLRTHSCAMCEKSFGTPQELRSHITWKHSPHSAKCPYCTYKTGNNSVLRLHIRRIHTHPGLKPFKCAYCDYRVACRANCRQHIIKHHPGCEVHYINDGGGVEDQQEQVEIFQRRQVVKMFKCAYCDYRCACRKNCRRHVMRFHPGHEIRYTNDGGGIDIQTFQDQALLTEIELATMEISG